MSEGFAVALPGGREAARAARRAFAENASALPLSLQEDLALLVTELVSNAVLHGGAGDDGPVQVEFRRQAGRVRVEVVNPGTAFEPPASPTNGGSSGGWGLLLVDQIAERWGIMPAQSGTCVWFELDQRATP
jgi:anti-sigma regulatory factor (Ser/Thr protein kinase)